VRLLWDVNARTVVVLFLVNAAIGLSATAQVQILRQLVETAGDVVAGTAPLLAGLGWGAALGALTLTQMAGNLAERRVADHFGGGSSRWHAAQLPALRERRAAHRGHRY